MRKSDFVTDMALDVLERQSLESLADVKKLQCGIVRKMVKVRDEELARRTGKPKGIYLTYDCPPAALSSEKGFRALAGYIAGALVELAGVMGRRSLVLVAGLGNSDVTADSLGGRVAEFLDVSPVAASAREREKVRLCAVRTGVEGRTGVRSADAVAGLCIKLKPSCVIAVDSLVTSVPGRIGTSFQLTTAGIAPGSGVGGERARLDRESLGVPVIAVGVPTVLAMRTVLYDTVKGYAARTAAALNEFALRELIAESKLGSLVVAPKEIGWQVEAAAAAVAGGINIAFGENYPKSRLTLPNFIH